MNYIILLDIIVFLKIWLVVILKNFLKWLVEKIPNNSLKFLADILNYSYIETISKSDYLSSSDESNDSYDSSVDRISEIINYSSDIDSNEIIRKKNKMHFLSFMLNINYSIHNKYRFQSDEGIYIIRNAFTFRKNSSDQVYNIISIENKLTIWCRIISPYNLYINDIKNLANETDDNFYFFAILEELRSGFKHKLLIDIKKRIYLPEKRSIMFSRISIQQYPQMTSSCD